MGESRYSFQSPVHCHSEKVVPRVASEGPVWSVRDLVLKAEPLCGLGAGNAALGLWSQCREPSSGPVYGTTQVMVCLEGRDACRT